MKKSMNYLPQAFITKGKKRIKQFEQTVYLNDGDNYEIELFNPTGKSVLAKINLDGTPISANGVVVRPGERLFLERFLDTNNKFLFNTYEVEDDTPLIKEAIKDNGKVHIQFYNESVPFWFGGTTYTTNMPYWNSGTSYNTITTSNIDPTRHVNYSTTSNVGTFNLVGGSTPVETGRTEGGEVSNQSFKNVSKNFEIFPMHSVEWQILPNSQKIYTKEDINKKYCGDCGSKIKKASYRFCPHCGSELN